jgi:hypothetical protein
MCGMLVWSGSKKGRLERQLEPALSIINRLAATICGFAFTVYAVGLLPRARAGKESVVCSDVTLPCPSSGSLLAAIPRLKAGGSQ